MDATGEDFQQTIDQLILEAVQAARNEYGVILDFSPDSFVELDKLLKRAHILYLSPAYAGKNPSRTIQVWGAYLGEMIRRTCNGTWKENPAANEIRRYSVTTPSGRIFPMEQVYLKVVPGIQQKNLRATIKEPPTRRVSSNRRLYLILGILAFTAVIGSVLVYFY